MTVTRLYQIDLREQSLIINRPRFSRTDIMIHSLILDIGNIASKAENNLDHENGTAAQKGRWLYNTHCR